MALDLNSRSCGVAFGDCDSGSPRCTTWRLPGCLDDDTLHRSLSFLRGSVSELCKLIHPRFVAVEAPFVSFKGDSNARTALAMISLAAVGCEAGTSAGARVTRVHVQSWRKHFTGQGRPDNPKLATQARCDLLGWKYANDDEADASGVWAFEMSRQFPAWAPKCTPLFGRSAA